MKLFKIYEQIEGEENKEPKKVTLSKFDKKILKLMSRKNIDNSDGSGIWKFLSDTISIDDQDLKLKISYIYMQDLIDEDEGESYDDLVTINLDIDELNDKFDDKIMALSSNLDVPPFLIEEERYGHYGLQSYSVDGGDEYAVGDEDEIEEAMSEYAQQRIDEGLDYFEEWWVEQYLEPNDSDIEQFAEEEADNRIEDMSDEEILDEAGYETPSDYEEYKEIKEGELEEKSEEKEELEFELNDLDIDEDEERMEELEYEIDILETDIRELEEEISELEDKMEDPGIEDAKDELRQKYIENTLDEVRDQGVSYFVDNLGMDYQDAVDYYFWFDEESAKYDLANEGYEAICTYDGDYDTELINDETYFIIRTN